MTTQDLWEAMDRKRRRLGVSWREIGRQLHEPPMTFSRMKSPDVVISFTKATRFMEWLHAVPTDHQHQWTPLGEIAGGRYRVMCQWCMEITETPPATP